MLNFINLSKFYNCAAMIRSIAFFFQPKLVPKFVCTKTSFSEIWALPYDFTALSYIYEEASIDWLYSAQLVACLAHVAVIVALLRKTLLVTVSFQLIFGCVFIYTKYSLFMIKYTYQRISFTACTQVTGNAHVIPRH